MSGAATRVITQKNAASSLAQDDEELISRFEPFSLLDVDLGQLLGRQSHASALRPGGARALGRLRAEAEKGTRRIPLPLRLAEDKGLLYC